MGGSPPFHQFKELCIVLGIMAIENGSLCGIKRTVLTEHQDLSTAPYAEHMCKYMNINHFVSLYL
jgi:hypothetical protein